jgi:hydroxypyruvate isomerase
VKVSACIEWLFGEGDRSFSDRVHAAADAGLDAVEFWLYENKDLKAIRRTADSRGIDIAGFVTQPFVELTDGSTHKEYLDGLERSCQTATDVDVSTLITQCGPRVDKFAEEIQFNNLASGLAQAAEVVEKYGITLLAEPLNIFDHPDQYLRHSYRGRDLVAAVNHPNLKMLYDRYHAFRMEEATNEGIVGFFDKIGEIHLAGPTRRDPTPEDQIDWRTELNAWAQAGFSGTIGLEYMPRGVTEDGLAFILAEIRKAFS